MTPEDMKQLLLTVLTPQDIARILTAQLPQPRTCENCGASIPVGHNGINHIMSVQHVIGSPGDPGIPPWQCASGEHWTCSPECWKSMAHKCIDEHMHPTLVSIHERLGK